METVAGAVFFLIPAWALGVFCYGIAAANLYLGYTRQTKKWPKRLKALNWIFMGSVLVYIESKKFLPIQTDLASRILTTIAIAFLILGEAAYHTNTFQDMIDSAIGLAKRLRHG